MDLSSLNPLELIDQFKAKARDWWATYQRWQAAAPQFKGSPLEARYNALMSDGLSVKSAISKAAAAIDSVANLIQQAKDALGIDGLPRGMPGGLGFLPLILPAAIIATVVLGWRAIDAWMENAKALEAQAVALAQKAQADSAAKLAAAGYTPEQIKQVQASTAAAAGQVATAAQPKPVLEQVKGVLLWGSVAFALIYFGPKVWKWWEGRRA